jgi:DMSO/TMAO reductase YedYZ molybdopterin-dependent catalytic subunit/rhodanese-related sulfurtransferase
MDEDTFVAVVTEGQPARPAYFDFDVRANREMHTLMDDAPPAMLGADEVIALVEQGALLLDPREPADFASGHLRGAVNVGLQGRFAEWAGAVLAPDRDIVLVGDPVTAAEAKTRLARVGYDRVAGQLADPGALMTSRPDLHETSSRLTIEQLAELRGLEPELQVVDLRGPDETASGTMIGAREIPLAALTGSIAGLDPDAAVVVYCASGYRSQIAASTLREAGFVDVSDVLGGYTAWQGADLPATTSENPTPPDVPEVRPRAAQAMVAAGALLLDVREPDEWRTGHAPDAVLMPMAQVATRRGELVGAERVVVVCRSGGRSAAVTQSLRAWGVDACNLAGGMSAWAAAGLPVVTTEADIGGLVVHRTRPLNCETSLPALIGGIVMPNARFYVRNHFDTPTLDVTSWRLELGGLVERPLRLSLGDLQRRPSHSLVATLECAGNGRSMFDPPVEGEQWQLGAASTAEWTGVPLAVLLDEAVPTVDATHVIFRGADRGVVDGTPDPISFERSLTVTDARHSDAVLAYAMNGDPLPVEHGYPVRLIVPGWYAVASVKWLTEIDVVGEPFEGFFQMDRYVFEWEREEGRVLEPVRHQRVRALITEPSGEREVPAGDVAIRGVAWSGAAPIDRVDVRIGDGEWQPARLVGTRQRHCWQWWELIAHLDRQGPTTVRARATDMSGNTQPERAAWNRLGYGANSIQVVELDVR